MWNWFIFLSFPIGVVLFNAPLAMAISPKNCDLFLEKDTTQKFISYLEQLLANNIIAVTELELFKNGLEQNKFINPILKDQTNLDSTRLIHGEEIQEYLDSSKLNLGAVLSWAETAWSKKIQIGQNRELTKEETKKNFWQIEFHPVQPGQVVTGRAWYAKKANLKYPFEVMNAPVTQWQWANIMEENSARFTDGPDALTVLVNGKSIQIQPDHPVENVTWHAALIFANKLSEKYHLKPVYDLSEMTWWHTNTQSHKGPFFSPKAGEVKINAPHGNIYEAEGFRLPTRAEQEYLIQRACEERKLLHFGNNMADDLLTYAWHKENSIYIGELLPRTHPVAELKPLIIDGNVFYDLLGNVSEWSFDYHTAEGLPGGENPINPRIGNTNFREVIGGSFQDEAFRFSSKITSSGNIPLANIGFRLVRTLHTRNVK